MTASLKLNTGLTQTFELPKGWTRRSLATALAREWLPPFRPAVVVKNARWNDRWTIQPIVEQPADGQPLWEAGISTAEYEQRLDGPDLAWTVQARTGRSRGAYNSIVLARLTINPNHPTTIDVVGCHDAMPEALFDSAKVAAFLEAHGHAGTDRFLASVLVDHGFQVASSC